MQLLINASFISFSKFHSLFQITYFGNSISQIFNEILFKSMITRCSGNQTSLKMVLISIQITYCDNSMLLTNWGRVMHICVSELPIIGSDNGLSPGLRQAHIWTNAGILLIRPLGTNFCEISIEILTFSKKMRLKVSSAKRRPFCLGLNVLT